MHVLCQPCRRGGKLMNDLEGTLDTVRVLTTSLRDNTLFPWDAEVCVLKSAASQA